MAGDVDGDRAIVWSRTDRPSRLIVEYATTESFTDAKKITGPAALEVTDFTARVDLSGLPAGQRIFYRASFQSLEDLKVIERAGRRHVHHAGGASAPCAATSSARDVTIAWTADTVGQGWGIDTNLGGMRLYDAMRKAEPDLFVHCGDTIYADQPLLSEVKLDDGARLEEPGDAGEEQAGRDARRVPRQSPLQPARRTRAALQRVGVAVRAVGRSRGPRQLVPDAKSSKRTRVMPRRASRCWPARAKRAFLEYTPMQDQPGRTGADLSRLPVRAAGRGLRLRHAHLSRRRTRANRQPAGANGARKMRRSSARRRSSG